jgi:hypothetical protein
MRSSWCCGRLEVDPHDPHRRVPEILSRDLAEAFELPHAPKTESFPVIHSIVLIVPRTQGLGKELA